MGRGSFLRKDGLHIVNYRENAASALQKQLYLSNLASNPTQLQNYYDKSWLTPMDRATWCVTPSRHHAVHKAGRWVWSTSVGRQSTVDNTWRRSTCHCEIILSSEVGEKLLRELCLFLEIFEFCICLINILQLLRLWPSDQKLWIQWTLCIGSKSHAHHDCIDLPLWSK